MKQSTKEILMTVLGADTTVTSEQVDLVLSVLSGEKLENLAKETEPYLTLKEAGRQLGISACSLWRWQVPGHKLGGRRMFRISEVEAYLNSQEMQLRAEELRDKRRREESK